MHSPRYTLFARSTLTLGSSPKVMRGAGLSPRSNRAGQGSLHSPFSSSLSYLNYPLTTQCPIYSYAIIIYDHNKAMSGLA